GFGIRDSGFGIRDSGFGIRDSGFGIRDSGFGIRRECAAESEVSGKRNLPDFFEKKRKAPSPPSSLGGEGWGEGATINAPRRLDFRQNLQNAKNTAKTKVLRKLKRRSLTQPTPPSA
ncbi:hypothetical protein, partial [Tahibacter harae]